jgi:hypothetical protein
MMPRQQQEEVIRTEQQKVGMDRRIEALLEQQNQLMLRHLALAEDERRRARSLALVKATKMTEQDILRRVDPNARLLFVEWRNHFQMNVIELIQASRACKKQQQAMEEQALVKPFLDEARKEWDWGSFYRSIATPINGVDISDVMQEPAGYSIDAAFAELRHRHALEAQEFIFAHQQVGLAKITENLALPEQIRQLHQKLETWLLQQQEVPLAAAACDEKDQCDNLHVERQELLEAQASDFVRLVHQRKMAEADCKIKAADDGLFGVSPQTIIVIVRVLCAVILLSAVWVMDHERLIQTISFMFSLGCGTALL